MDNSIVNKLVNWAELFLKRKCEPKDMRYIISSAKGLRRRDKKITIYVFYKDDENPIGVAKTSLVGDYELIARQYDQIGFINSLNLSSILVPQPLEIYSTGRFNFYIESYVQGKSLNYRYNRDISHFAKAISWLTEFHQITKSDNNEVLKIEVRKWGNIIKEAQCVSHDIKSYINKVLIELEQFAGKIPVVFMQGDYHLGQILKTDSNEICIVDWEHSLKYGLPVLDLIEFLVLSGVVYRFYPTVDISFNAFFYEKEKQKNYKMLHCLAEKNIQDYFDCLGLKKSDFKNYLLLFMIYNLARTIDLRGNMLLMDDIADRIRLLEMFSQKEILKF